MASKNINFSKRLYNIVIDQLGWSKTKFAREIDIHINSVTNYLEKGVVPEWDILLRICDKLKLSVDFILRDEPIEERSEINEIVKTFGHGGKKNHIKQLYEKPHNEIISLFEDKEWAREINRKLVEIERSDPGKKELISAFIEGVRIGLAKSKKGQGPDGAKLKKDAPIQSLASAEAKTEKKTT